VGEYGEPPLQNEPPSIKLKIRKILMPSKSSNKFTLIDELSSQFPKVYTVTLKLLNTVVIGDSCRPLKTETKVHL